MRPPSHMFCGFHLVGELYDIRESLLNDPVILERSLRRGIGNSGATLCGLQLKQFEPRGVTILALLSESHASIHTYPEQGAMFIDAFTCGPDCRPQAIAQALIEDLGSTRHKIEILKRGAEDGGVMQAALTLGKQDSVVIPFRKP